MADFNPDQFLADTAQAGFDPDKFLSETSGANPKAKSEGIGGHLNAAMRGAVQGASMGFADEASAGVNAVRDYLSAKAGLRGDVSFGDAYRTNRDAIRKADDQAHAEHPGLYTGATIGGGLATAAIPGIGLAAQGAKAGLGGAMATGAGFGGLSGLGDSRSDMTSSLAGVGGGLKDAAHGAAVGAATGGLLYGAGKVGSAVLDKLRPAKIGSVLLNTPEEALQTYINNPDAVNNAPTRRELAQRFPGLLDKLKQETIEGSQASRQILDQEGGTVMGSEISDILGGKAQGIKDRLLGINDDPEKSAAAGWLQKLSDEYAPKAGAPAQASGLLDASGRPIMGEAAPAVDRALPTNRVKDFLQSLDKQTQWETAPGQFTNVDNATKQDVRSTIDALLKDQSPAYAEQMKKVAADAGLLNEVTDVTGKGSVQGIDNLFKRIQKDRNFDAAKSIGEMDQRMGTTTLQELKLAEAKEAMGKGYTNGSRAVNLYKEFGGKNPVARAAFGAVGATVDKYGAPIARGLVDKSAQIQQMLNSSEGLQRLGPYANLLKEAAQKGNQSLAAAHFVLSQSDPNYNKIFPTEGGE